MTEIQKTRCFVIMPFSKTTDAHTTVYWTDHYDKFLKPKIELNATVEAHRSAPLHGNVLSQIITDIVTSRIVVADLTDRNPNVYWELGVRQSFAHGTITIAEEGTVLPFDIGVKGTLFYGHLGDRNTEQKFTTDFCLAVTDCLKNPESVDSHVLETIGGREPSFKF